MLAIASFALAMCVVLGCVWWACANAPMRQVGIWMLGPAVKVVTD